MPTLRILRSLLPLALAVLSALVLACPAAASKGPRPQVWIVNRCGEEVLRPRMLRAGCPGAGSYPIVERGQTFHGYGHTTAEASAVFSVCLQGPRLPAAPSFKDWKTCYEADVTPQEAEQEWHITVHGTWRFWHIVRCTAIPGRAHGTRLFYGFTGLKLADGPWWQWSTDAEAPLNYTCPKL